MQIKHSVTRRCTCTAFRSILHSCIAVRLVAVAVGNGRPRGSHCWGKLARLFCAVYCTSAYMLERNEEEQGEV